MLYSIKTVDILYKQSNETVSVYDDDRLVTYFVSSFKINFKTNKLELVFSNKHTLHLELDTIESIDVI